MSEEEKFIRNKIEESTRLIEASSYIGNKKAYAKERTQFKCVLNLIQKQQNKIDQLESDKQKLIEKLEEDIAKANEIINDQEYRYIDEVIDEQYERRKYAKEILSILKGENDE